MKALAIITALIVAIITSVWFSLKPNWDSAAATGAALVALLSTFFLPNKKESTEQSQTIGDNSNGIQAGRDVNIR